MGLAAALSCLQNVGIEQVGRHTAALTHQAIAALREFPRVRLLGPVEQLEKEGHLISFVVDGMHAHDVAAYLDRYGICVRAGHHCAQPLAEQLHYQASVRASFYLYTTERDVELFIKALRNMMR